MIRRALPSDIERLLAMGNAFFVEAGWNQHAQFDSESFSYACAALMESGIILVAEKDGQVVGMAGAGTAPAFWNRNVLTCQELFWYVEPQYRRSRRPIGLKLMVALEEAAASLGVMLFSMSAEEGLRSATLGSLYQRRGFFPMERLFWKRLGTEGVAA